MPEIDYKVKFCEKYFNKNFCEYDVLNEVDVLLRDKNHDILLYIESKYILSNEKELRKALAQLILTNHKQRYILDKVALIYQDKEGNDFLLLVDCSDNSIMYNNDLNWAKEKASSPTSDAINRINDRIRNHIITYKNKEIKEFYRKLFLENDVKFNITLDNINVVYSQWKEYVRFVRPIKNEQELINLFLVDVLNGCIYTKKVKEELMGEVEHNLIREGTDLRKYEFVSLTEGKSWGFLYNQFDFFILQDKEKHDLFWEKYIRPPEENEFIKILERSDVLYSDKYRRDTGGEYTPSCFVKKQNEILHQNYDMNEFIVCDVCAGVGNLEHPFGRDYYRHCYLSTLEVKDVDICKIKGFENVVQFDYLKDDEQPRWKYKGELLTASEIAQRENRKLMIIINPPYQKNAHFKNNLAIEFFDKILKLKPQVIVFYYMTESFLRPEVEHYIRSKYKIVSHIFSSAKTTFLLSDWSVSQVVFDKDKGERLNLEKIKADRYELNTQTDRLEYIKTYNYENKRPNLIKEIEKEIKANKGGIILGNYCYLNNTMNFDNKPNDKLKTKITTKNLSWCLLSKGLNFNTHHKYFELNSYVYKGIVEDIPKELFSDALCFSLFYIHFAFSNKNGLRNYIMPFTAKQLGCRENDLNVLYPNDWNLQFQGETKEEPFDFRAFLSQFTFSQEAQNLFDAALEIFRYYHKSGLYSERDWNDSFYDITNAIMGKSSASFKEWETEKDTRIEKVKTTKGTTGFGRNTFKRFVPKEYHSVFLNFFDARDVLAKKINRLLVENHLLLWERENIY